MESSPSSPPSPAAGRGAAPRGEEGFPTVADAVFEATQFVGGPFEDVPSARACLDAIDHDDSRLHNLELRIGAALTDLRDGLELFEISMLAYAQRAPISP